MSKEFFIQTAFNGGELSPRLNGRIDFEKYKTGCSQLLNMLPTPQGSVIKRSGTRFVAETKTSTTLSVLIPFRFSTTDAYALEFGDQYMRVFKNGAVVGAPYELVTPYLQTDVHTLQFAQSADVIYIASKNHAPRKLSRTSDTSWSLDVIDFNWQPFQDENPSDTALMYASANGGAITITSSGHSPFTSAHVGSYIKFREMPESVHDSWAPGTAYSASTIIRYEGNVYFTTLGGTSGNRPPIHMVGTSSDGGVDWLYLHSGEGYAAITSYISPTQVDAVVVKTLPFSVVGAPSATFRWSWGSWSALFGYPKAVTFFEDRLIWAGSTFQPQTIWGSQSGDYENHLAGAVDSDAYQYTLGSDQVNVIEWLNAGKVLNIGTAGGEFSMSGSRIYEAITPTNVRVVRQTTFGSAEARPIRLGDNLLFVTRSNKKLRDLQYYYDNDSYLAPDLTILSEHITSTGVANGSWQQEPMSIVWYPRFVSVSGSSTGDGYLLGVTYDKTEDVFAWHAHQIAGGVVESVACIPHPDGDQDQLWMIVRRTINGLTKRYVEYMEKPFSPGTSPEDAFFVDCGITYNGSATTTISGLAHLEGETVKVLADGATHPDKVVLGGQITLDRSASKVQVGCGYDAVAATMSVEAGADAGTAQSRNKRISSITARVLDTGSGLFYGPDLDNLQEMSFRNASMLMDTAVPLFSGDKGPQEWPTGYERDLKIFFKHTLPMPFHLLAVIADTVTYDK